MLFRQFCAILAAAALSGAAPAPVKHVLHEKREERSLDWVKGDRVESNAILPVRIGLTQNNLEKGYDYLMDVYALENQCTRAKK
jgi:tripeptidyl-peptidase-1